MITEILLTCALLSPLTPEQVTDYLDCKERNEIIYFMEDYVDIFAEYFNKEDIETALRITYCESTGRPQAINTNTNGTTDVGLWQFNDDTWAWLKPKLGIISNRTNPEVSTAIAAWLVYNDGWHHWNSSKHCWKGTNNDLLWTQTRTSMRGN